MNFSAPENSSDQSRDAGGRDASRTDNPTLLVRPARRYWHHKAFGIIAMITIVILMTLNSTLLIIGAFIFASFAFLIMALEDSERAYIDAEIRAARHETAKIEVERENTDLRQREDELDSQISELWSIINSASRGEAVVALEDSNQSSERMESSNVIFINSRQPKGAA